jgi:hypothetical protein
MPEGNIMEHKTGAGLRAQAKCQSKIAVGTWKTPGQFEGQIVEGGQGMGGKKHTRAGAVDLNRDDILNRIFECERRLLGDQSAGGPR